MEIELEDKKGELFIERGDVYELELKEKGTKWGDGYKVEIKEKWQKRLYEYIGDIKEKE